MKTRKRMLTAILTMVLLPTLALAHDHHHRVRVPEPSSMAFAGMGLAGLVAAIRRKARNA